MQNPGPGAQTFESMQAFVDAYPEQLQTPINRSVQAAYEVAD